MVMVPNESKRETVVAECAEVVPKWNRGKNKTRSGSEEDIPKAMVKVLGQDVERGLCGGDEVRSKLRSWECDCERIAPRQGEAEHRREAEGEGSRPQREKKGRTVQERSVAEW